MKILIINPHLSTGGCPEYLYQFLIHNRHNYTQLKVIEFSNFSNDYVVQKNKIKNLIGKENVICLGDFWEEDELFISKKYKLLDIINDYDPEIIWFNEFPERFEYKLPPDDLIKKIYSSNRRYKIIETTHSNDFDFSKKRFIPDEFMFCSDIHMDKSININIKKYIWEVPLENKSRPDRDKTLKSLGLDPSYLHVLNVGIINKNKNQKYLFDLAETLKFYKIQFHFIGNSCFLNECGISKSQLSLSNCKIWGERSDVDVFMSCMDIFLFPSHNELNPLSVKEALSWNMQVICKKCENYTNKYINKTNFHILENMNVSNFILQNLKNLKSMPSLSSSCIKFAIYTTFYNCSKYVDTIFENILRLKYDNFTWFITDDFSTDNTKDLILKNLKLFNSNKIKYVNQNFKKEMYWQPNNFIDETYEYIILVDADDLFDFNFLNIYNKYLSQDKDIAFVSSDFKKVNESDNSLHSLSLIKNDEPLKSKINKFHPYIDYLNNLNYYCFGSLRCFKNDKNLKFTIKDFDACAEDSYHTMYANAFGKWLHIPRNLYTWNYRNHSESHGIQKKNFNDNFDLGYQKLINSPSLIDTRFDTVYKETCALNFLNINSYESVSLFTKNKNTEILLNLYSDVKLSINNIDFHDVYIIVCNYFNEIEIKNIILNFKNKSARIIFYKLDDNKYDSNEQKDKSISDNLNIFLEKTSSFVNVNYWFLYIRHLYAIASYSEKIILNDSSINITNESGSLGDAIAWVPIVNEYALQKNQKVNFYTPYKELFIKSYPMINFFEYNEKPENKNIIKIGCFEDNAWRNLSLQQIASNCLGIEHKEIRCKIDYDKTKKSSFNKKYVCIATQSTGQFKYWNNKEGWKRVIDYLNSLGYDVVCIDKHSSFGIVESMNKIPENAIDKTGDLSLHDRINDLHNCEFFIGLGSGLSWLAWACDKPVIMISGFSDPKSEFFTPYRVHNKNVCNSCWNDSSLFFDRNNWMWCPRNKNFECSKEITFDMVREKIDLLIKDISGKSQIKSLVFDKISMTNFDSFTYKEIFEYNQYEKYIQVDENDFVVDMGCSQGYFYFKNYYKNIKYLGIDASIDCLKDFISNASDCKNMKLINAAISNKKEILNFSSIFHKDKYNEVLSMSFEDLTFLLNRKIDFLKFDIEGFEKFFLFDDIDLFKKYVKKFSGELHFINPICSRQQMIDIITIFKLDNQIDFKLFSIDGFDITESFWSHTDYYTEIIISGYIK